MQTIHGGDIYRNRIQIDFSVNINPLGIPEEVKDALHQAVDVCMQYPDMEAEQLKEALSRKFCLPKTYFLPGNGASELFLGILHALKPKKVILPVPSFYGFELFLLFIDFNLTTSGYTACSHTTSNYGCVRCHTTTNC